MYESPYRPEPPYRPPQPSEQPELTETAPVTPPVPEDPAQEIPQGPFSQDPISEEPAHKKAASIEEADDTQPLTLDELKDAGKEFVGYLRDVPLKPFRRAIRATIEAFSQAAASASKELSGEKNKDNDQ